MKSKNLSMLSKRRTNCPDRKGMKKVAAQILTTIHSVIPEKHLLTYIMSPVTNCASYTPAGSLGKSGPFHGKAWRTHLHKGAICDREGYNRDLRSPNKVTKNEGGRCAAPLFSVLSLYKGVIPDC
jgi:hypothetical protein